MKHIQKKAWPVWGMIILTVLLNLLIISVSDKNQPLLWMLIMPGILFLIADYFSWQRGSLMRRHFADRLQVPLQFSQSKKTLGSIDPVEIRAADLTVRIGNDQCRQPYDVCIFNAGTITHLAPGQNLKNVTIDDGIEETACLPADLLKIYQLASGGLIWQIGSSFAGCRDENGHFCSHDFKKIASRPRVKMIELNLSPAKTVRGFVDSVLELVQPVAQKTGNGIFSQKRFTTFCDAEGMIHFLGNLRELSGRKPIGIRLSIMDKKEFYQICYYINKTQIFPDFIVVVSSVKDNSGLHLKDASHSSLPLYDSLLFVSQTLGMYGLRSKIRVIADETVNSGFEILKLIALGADLICTETPRYDITKYAGTGKKLSFVRSQNLHGYHRSIMQDLARAMNYCGFRSVGDITLSKFFSRVHIPNSKGFPELSNPVSYTATLKNADHKQISPVKQRKLKNETQKKVWHSILPFW